MIFELQLETKYIFIKGITLKILYKVYKYKLEDLMIENIVGKDYKLVKKLGSGAFGQVFQAIHTKNHTQYAVKLQKANTKSPQLFYEAKILNSFALQDNLTSDYGIPRVYYCGTEGQYNVMVMDLCGKSLQQLFNSCGKKIDLKTTLLVGYQMIERVQFIHNRFFLHRDIKPDNFVVGTGKKASKVFLIDFGLAKKYLLKDGSHIPYKDTKNLTGTARFASLNTHLGIQQGRRDDIEGIANVLIYLHKGSVPWQNLRANNKKQKYEKIMQKKLSVPIQKICQGMPQQFNQLLTYSRTLQFQQNPDYVYLKDLFKNALKRQGFNLDYKYCWDKQK